MPMERLLVGVSRNKDGVDEHPFEESVSGELMHQCVSRIGAYQFEEQEKKKVTFQLR